MWLFPVVPILEAGEKLGKPSIIPVLAIWSQFVTGIIVWFSGMVVRDSSPTFYKFDL